MYGRHNFLPRWSSLFGQETTSTKTLVPTNINWDHLWIWLFLTIDWFADIWNWIDIGKFVCCWQWPRIDFSLTDWNVRKLEIFLSKWVAIKISHSAHLAWASPTALHEFALNTIDDGYFDLLELTFWFSPIQVSPVAAQPGMQKTCVLCTCWLLGLVPSWLHLVGEYSPFFAERIQILNAYAPKPPIIRTPTVILEQEWWRWVWYVYP